MSGPWPSFWSVCVNTFGVAPSHDGSEFWLRDGPWSPWWHSTICCQWPRGCWPWGAMSGGRRRGEGGRHEWRARSQPAVTLGEIGNNWEWGYLELFVLSCWPAVPVVLVQYQKSVLSLFVAKFGTHTTSSRDKLLSPLHCLWSRLPCADSVVFLLIHLNGYVPSNALLHVYMFRLPDETIIDVMLL